MLGPRQQGDLGEVAAIAWLVAHGYAVYLPLGHSPDVDVIAERDGVLARVQVKTTTRAMGAERWQPMLCTRGGNQSWNGLVKHFSATRCDFLFVVVGDGRQWFIPAGAIEARTAIMLGGPKYAEYEVERGRSLAAAAGR